MRIRSKILIAIYNDTAQKEALFAPSDAGSERTLTQFTEMCSGRMLIDNNDTFTVPKGTIDEVCGVSIRADKDITLTFDGDNVIALKRPPAAGDGLFEDVVFAADMAFTTLEITSTDGVSDVTGTFVVWGDPEEA